ncbi:MAG: DUF4349 domain-containing protein [Pseudomonadota bacterium]
MMDLKPLARAAAGLVLIGVLAACSKSEMSRSRAPLAEPVEAKIIEEVKQAAPAAPAPAAADSTVTSATPTQQMGSSAATYTDSERKFIRTAHARFRVKDVYVSALGIEDIVASHGGFVVKNDISAESISEQLHPIGDGKLMELNEYAVNGHLIVRVPSAKTQEFLRAIVGHVVFLDERNFAARDAQFDLLRQQLGAMRSQETQTDLGQAVKDGGKLVQKTDAISARNQVKAERDAALIAKKEFEDQVAFSTIDLKLYQPSKVLQSERVDVDSVYRQARPGFFSRAGEQMRGGWEGLQNFVLVLFLTWPLVLAVGVIAAIVWRVRRQRRNKPV